MSKWPMVKLCDVCSINMGQSPESSSYNENSDGIPFYQGNADFGELYPVVRFYCNAPTKIAQKNDLLISVRAPIGALNIATEKCCIGRGLAALTVHSGTDIKYLYYVLIIKRDEFNQRGTGSTFKAINKQILCEMKIPLPPLEEQRRIAATLDTVSEILKLRKVQLAELDDLVKSQFIEMFGDPVMNPMGWTIEPLSDHLKIIGGYAFKSTGFLEKGIPVLRIGNINAGSFRDVNLVFWDYDESLKRYLLYPGDLVISLTGTVGKDDYGNVCVLGSEYSRYYLNQRNAKLELSKTLNKNYIVALLKVPEVKARLTDISRGVRQANISNSDILNLEVPVPPISLQNQFDAFVQQVDKSKFEIQKGLEEIETLQKALMQEYFG